MTTKTPEAPMTTDQERRMVALIDAEIAKPEQEDSLYVRIFKAGMSAPSLSPAVQAVVDAWKALRNEELRIWGTVEIDHAGRCGAQTNALMKACEQLAAVRAETGDTQ